MPTDPLAAFVNEKVRQMHGEEAPLRLEPTAPGDVGYNPPTHTPAEYAVWRTPPPPAPGATEPTEEEGSDAPEPGSLEAAVAGWFPPRELVKLDPGGSDEEPPGLTTADFLEEIQTHAEAEGIEPDEWLFWAATTSREEWAAACEAAGWPESARPGLADLPPGLRMAAAAAQVPGAKIAVDPLHRRLNRFRR